MPRTRIIALLVCLFATMLGPTTAMASIDAIGPLALDSDPIRPRRQVPDDPLAGLPSDEDGRPAKGKVGGNKGAASCRLDGTPSDARAIGDLRAALALVQRGPRSWPCPPRAAGASLALRITVDGTGKITSVDAATGNSALAASIGKKLAGKSISPRAAGSTTGTVMLSFTPGKGR
jgi:hypothetical protein